MKCAFFYLGRFKRTLRGTMFIYMTKHLLFFSVFILIFLLPRVSYGAESNHDGLLLNIDLGKIEYVDKGQMRFFLRLNYTNRTRSDILLYRYSSAVVESWLSKNCNVGKCEIIQNLQYNSDIYFGPNSRLTREDFVNLKPTESIQVYTTFDLLVGNGFDLPVKKSENYQLKILVKTLYGQIQDYDRIKKAFFRKSKLWTRDTLSLPLNISF